MKFLCSGCERLVPASSFRSEGEALLLTCARCGVENALEVQGSTVPPRAPAPPPNPSPPAPVSQPIPRAAQGSLVSNVSLPPLPTAPPPQPSRVVSLRSVTDAVKLAADAATSDSPFEVPPDRCPKCVGSRPADEETCPHCGLTYVNFRPDESLPSSDVAEAFRSAMQHWDDPSRHDAVLSLATQRGELPSVGRLYRIRLVAAPLDPVAQRGRDEVVRRASAAGEAMRQLARDDGDSKTPRWQLAALLVLLLGVAAMVVVVLRQRSAD